MNLRELLSWGVVRKLHRQGERRELFRAEPDVWILFRRILKERKRRELDPTLTVLDRIFRLAENEPDLPELKSRVERLRQFFGMIEALSIRLLSLEPASWPTWASSSRAEAPARRAELADDSAVVRHDKP